jgi:hypothetical protein
LGAETGASGSAPKAHGLDKMAVHRHRPALPRALPPDEPKVKRNHAAFPKKNLS